MITMVPKMVICGSPALSPDLHPNLGAQERTASGSRLQVYLVSLLLGPC